MGKLYSQPQIGPGDIDWSNPITRGLIFAGFGFPFQDVAGPNRTVNKNGSPSARLTTKGVVGGFSSASSQYFTETRTPDSLTEFSLFCLSVFDDTATQRGQVTVTELSTVNRLALFVGATSGKVSMSFVSGGGVATNAVSSASVSTGTLYAIGGSYSQGARLDVYINGKKEGSNTPSGTMSVATTVGIGSRCNGSWGSFANGGIGIPLVWNRALSDAEHASLAANPWQIFAPNRMVVLAGTGGSSDNLTVADATHAHTADNLTLTSSTAITIADATHAHAADNLVLTSETAIAIAEALHGHTADNVTLSLAGSATLAIADALHDHTADSLALTADYWLAVADAIHAHAADNLDLTSATALAIAEALHAHRADNITFLADLTDSERIALILKILRNKQTLDPANGTFTLYDDDETTVLLTAAAWEDAAGTIPYRGQGLGRLDEMQ